MAANKIVNSKFEYTLDPFAQPVPTYEQFITSEVRAYLAKYADPLTLCFKLLIDFDKPYGLFAAEENVNSALGYLKRIGDVVRYEMLKHWIEVFKLFVRNYDFLILNCDGLDTIINIKPGDSFTENDKITLTIRETSDMFIQAILTQYRQIWYDNNRGVEILPANLRRFDIKFLVYNAGYFNMGLYDQTTSNNLTDLDVDTLIYPTIKKLSEGNFQETGPFKFNHHLISIYDASINNEESGKSFFASINNEMQGDYVKNTMVFNFRFANYSGMFYNTFGNFDFTKTLAMLAAQGRFTNEIIFAANKFANQSVNMVAVVTETTAELSKSQKFLAKITAKLAKYLNAIIGPFSPIGDAIRDLVDPSFYQNLIMNAVDQALQAAEDKYIYGTIAKLNNLMTQNFPTDLYGTIQNLLHPQEQNPKIENSNINQQVKTENVSFEDRINALSGEVSQNVGPTTTNPIQSGIIDNPILTDWRPVQYDPNMSIYTRKNF